MNSQSLHRQELQEDHERSGKCIDSVVATVRKDPTNHHAWVPTNKCNCAHQSSDDTHTSLLIYQQQKDENKSAWLKQSAQSKTA